MGGLVNTSIRFEDGEIINTLVYTNGINFIFGSKAFYDRDKESLKKILSALKQKSWDKKTFNSVAPYHYGFIVADFQTNRIIDMQSYSVVGSYMGNPYFPNNVDYPEDFISFKQDKDYKFSDFSLIIELFLNNQIMTYNDYDLATRQETTIEHNSLIKTEDEVIEYIKKMRVDYIPINIDYQTGCMITTLESDESEQFIEILKNINYPLKNKDIENFNLYATGD